MDGPRDCHIEWSQTEKEKYCMISLICRILKNDTNELIYKTETDSDLENELMVTRGKGWGGGTDWQFGIDMYTLLYLKIDNQQGPTV